MEIKEMEEVFRNVSEIINRNMMHKPSPDLKEKQATFREGVCKIKI